MGQENHELLILPEELVERVASQGETKMGGFHTGKVILHDGRTFIVEVDNATYLFHVEGYERVPFSVDEIADIIVTHETIDHQAWTRKLGDLARRGLIDFDAGEEKKGSKRKTIGKK